MNKNLYCECGDHCSECSGPLQHVDFKLKGKIWHVCAQGIITGPGCNAPHIFESGKGIVCLHNGELYEIEEEIGDIVVVQRQIVQASLDPCSGECPHVEQALRNGYPIPRFKIDGVFDSKVTFDSMRPKMEKLGLLKA